jgi:hypothetical protein
VLDAAREAADALIMASLLLPTTVVGSYVQPGWLVDRGNLGARLPPRVRARELWKIPETDLEDAQDAATLMAIRDMERAGVDIVSDGEIRRESYSNRFATALDGIDVDHPGTALDRTGHANPVPRIVGKIRRTRPVEVRDAEFLVASTTRRTKITLPGPFTMMQHAQNDYYATAEAAAMDYAEAVNAEILDLFAAGVDTVQLDEPYMQARPQEAKKYAVRAINRALDGVKGTRRCTCASATRTSSTSGRRATRSCPSSRPATPTSCPSRLRSRSSICRSSGSCRPSGSWSASWPWATTSPSKPPGWSPIAFAVRSTCSRLSACWWCRTAA